MRVEAVFFMKLRFNDGLSLQPCLLIVCKTIIVKGLFRKTFWYRMWNDETLDIYDTFQNIHI